MGNTLTTQASTHPAPSNTNNITTPSATKRTFHHQTDSRPSTAGLSPSGQSSLRKMESSSTLSSVARFYSHTNHSGTSMSSKLSKSSGWRKQQAAAAAAAAAAAQEKILDIGKPTQFEHGIHVEYNKDNGRFMVNKSNIIYINKRRRATKTDSPV